MSSEDNSQDQALNAAVQFIAEQLNAGQNARQIESMLVAQGADPGVAASLVAEVKKLRSNAIRADGFKNLGIGALWCVGGIIVTAVSYSMAASSASGGSYLVTWGAVIFGGIQMLRGLFRILSGK